MNKKVLRFYPDGTNAIVPLTQQGEPMNLVMAEEKTVMDKWGNIGVGLIQIKKSSRYNMKINNEESGSMKGLTLVDDKMFDDEDLDL